MRRLSVAASETYPAESGPVCWAELTHAPPRWRCCSGCGGAPPTASLVAEFGPAQFFLRARATWCEPRAAHEPLRNQRALRGSVALLQDGGGTTFCDKVLRAQAAGAVGVIVVHSQHARFIPHAEPWEDAHAVTIPVVCVGIAAALELMARVGSDSVTVKRTAAKPEEPRTGHFSLSEHYSEVLDERADTPSGRVAEGVAVGTAANARTAAAVHARRRFVEQVRAASEQRRGSSPFFDTPQHLLEAALSPDRLRTARGDGSWHAQKVSTPTGVEWSWRGGDLSLSPSRDSLGGRDDDYDDDDDDGGGGGGQRSASRERRRADRLALGPTLRFSAAWRCDDAGPVEQAFAAGVDSSRARAVDHGYGRRLLLSRPAAADGLDDDDESLLSFGGSEDTESELSAGWTPSSRGASSLAVLVRRGGGSGGGARKHMPGSTAARLRAKLRAGATEQQRRRRRHVADTAATDRFVRAYEAAVLAAQEAALELVVWGLDSRGRLVPIDPPRSTVEALRCSGRRVLLADVLTEIYLCDVCSCHRNIETQRPRPAVLGRRPGGSMAGRGRARAAVTTRAARCCGWTGCLVAPRPCSSGWRGGRWTSKTAARMSQPERRGWARGPPSRPATACAPTSRPHGRAWPSRPSGATPISATSRWVGCRLV
jgi:hypothetical protein